MAILSRFPMDRESLRTFQTFRWSRLPDALRPIDPNSGDAYYSDRVWNALRLSSKNHVDIPIWLSGDTDSKKQLHVLASHPTPPVFDGAEDRNGCRNHDEIRFWNDYLANSDNDYLTDDQGRAGGIRSVSRAGDDAFFVIMGDLNSDPNRGDSIRSAISGLLVHPRVQDVQPKSEREGTSTALFGSRKVRVDYVLPSTNLMATDSGVVWPASDTFLGRSLSATDHRMVWVDVLR